MQGFILLVGADTSSRIELPKSKCLVTLINDDLHVISAEETTRGTPLFHTVWDRRRRSWVATQAENGIPCTINKTPLTKPNVTLNPDHPVLVKDWGEIEYQAEIATPIYQGNPINTLPLTPSIDEIIIGRASNKDSDNDPPKLKLDSDDLTISKSQARLTYQNNIWHLEDLSSGGTDYNGKIILGKQPLVYGDRIRISDYLFEFNDTSLQRIDHIQTGNLIATDLSVIVKDRVTGEPLPILQNVSTTVKPGEFIGILGGSGQGKSTLLEALCGMSPATSGTVTIDGIPNDILSKARPGSIGYVPQDDIVHLELTIDQAFLYSARLKLTLKTAELKSLIDKTIETLGLTEHRSKRIKYLSGGQRKRVSIGIELLSKPSILFLDEPSSGLDPTTEQSLMELLQALSLNNLTVICTTHVLQNAHIFNRLFYIHGGRLIFTGTGQQARDFFLDQGHTQTHNDHQTQTRATQSPLERIYSTVINGNKTAEEWERKFHQHRPPVKPHTPQKKDIDNIEKKKQPSPFKKILTLLRRQMSIMQADWMNTTFLLAQVIIIGLLISWVSDDLGLRTFLGLIAAMWFGCSNGAQQIVGELPILQRERVCGLGLNVYVLSKMIFQGAVSTIQCIILFVIIIAAGNYFHPPEFEHETFMQELVERENPYLIDNSISEDADEGFMPLEEGSQEDSYDAEGLTENDHNEEDEVAPPPITPPYPKAIAFIAKHLYLKENILESGKQGIDLSDGSPLMGKDGKQKSTSGTNIWEIINICLSMRIGAFFLITLVGVSLGLMVSALVRTTTQAVMWVPLILIPQILFGGFVIKRAEMSDFVRTIASYSPSNAAQRLVDVSHIFGRMTPTLSNRTETPLFLTSNGAKKKITWEENGKKLTQSYDKISEVNTSWQNLAVRDNLLGEHKQHFEIVYGTRVKMMTDTITRRRDVKYSKGSNFLYTRPAQIALTILGFWMLASYIIIIIGLWKKKA
jgi:ABC-type multidrug transport system ATPase subunit